MMNFTATTAIDFFAGAMVVGSAAASLAWLAFWVFAILYLWFSHVQYMAGHETHFFRHKTPEEMRLREISIREREIAFGITPTAHEVGPNAAAVESAVAGDFEQPDAWAQSALKARPVHLGNRHTGTSC